ncbi:MAG TPA: peptidoglycan-binding domain-containing protein, partial [Nevskiaceae bacterium]|nr:peptidoglycan-binding domain-containing protein [Nevskiaceae bacterium]
TKLVAVPATYKMATQRVLVSAAHDKWVPGQGAIQKRAADGSLMCLVRVPAVYKTVRVRQVATAATTRSVTTPAVYKTVRVRTVVKPAGQQTVTIPATYQTVSHTNLTKAATVEWSRVVCHDNANSSLITQVQNALKKNGFNPGPIDGLFGPLTAGATNRYDKAHGLATNGAGVITYQTLDSLGVKHSS